MPFGDGSHRHDAVILREKPLEDAFSSSPGARGDDSAGVARLYPQLREWLPVLTRLKLSPDEVAELARRSSRVGTCFMTELLASGIRTEEKICRAVAASLGVGCMERVEAGRLVVPDEIARMHLQGLAGHKPVKFIGEDGAINYLVPYGALDIPELRSWFDEHSRFRHRLKLVSPGVLRDALLARFRPALVGWAVSGLFERYPDLSARFVMNAWQGLLGGALLVALPALLWFAPGASWLAMHILFSFFFMACVGLRFAAFLNVDRRHEPPAPVVTGGMPVYSLLVALYREAHMVPELVSALERLEWPRSRIEIKLVCEADDRETLEALRSLSLPMHYEIVEVPQGGPRTKPRALAYASSLIGGEFVALYDAEDHPHPRQLLHAWQVFRDSPAEVVCVQAPLEIANRSSGLLARMFAFEYAALFRGLLPWLSGRRLPVPLGGTSNHFRRSALAKIGGWDPYNVTEDADLGMRLARFGYRTETIRCPTWETAPETLAAWVPQRTRWFKGWIKTWLVHMRSPAVLFRELGLRSFLVGQILFAGMVLSALAHPVLLVTGLVLTIDLALGRPGSSWQSALLAIDFASVAGGYLSFLLLGWRVLNLREKFAFWKIVIFTPVYWMMLSWAAWRAVWQLWRQPHLWEKTPHRPLRGS